MIKSEALAALAIQQTNSKCEIITDFIKDYEHTDLVHRNYKQSDLRKYPQCK